MSKKIRLVLDAKGNVKQEYSGFVGGECFKEAELLRATLRDLGVDLELEGVVPVNTPIPEVEGEAPEKELEGS